MILANVRVRLDRNDAQLVLRLIAAGSSTEYRAAEQRLADEGIEPLLDDPRLLRGLLRARQGQCASLALFTYVLVRHALLESGEPLVGVSHLNCSTTSDLQAEHSNVAVVTATKRKRWMRIHSICGLAQGHSNHIRCHTIWPIHRRVIDFGRRIDGRSHHEQSVH
ncbi:MAG: hypothetical protein MUE41_06705 [Gemmatimonadaceae bacterium]|nr:hypothetical protein [Gemmatimonadaceae bacterium]